MALDAIIFDVDGTLINSNDLHVDVFQRAFAAFDYKVLPDRIKIEIGKGGDNLVPAILGPAAENKDGDAIRKEQGRQFKKLAEPSRLQPFSNAKELLQAVRHGGLKVVIATSSGKEQLHTLGKMSGLNFDELADVIVTADDAKNSKPAPDLIAAAVKKAGLSPAQCVMVGDTIYDARSARHAGVISLGVLCGGNSTEDLLSAGMRRVYADPTDLLNHLEAAIQIASPGSIHLTNAIMERLMEAALDAAKAGMADGEVPIGCVLCRGDGSIIAQGWNRLNRTQNKTMHAEIVTFAAAAGKIPADAKDLILVSTLEPCVMCTGAAMEAAVDTIVFALRAPADAGSGRVTPPQSPDVQMPRIIGDVLANQSLELFRKWYAENATSPQARYIEQLLELQKSV